MADNAGSSAPNQDGAPLTYTDVQRRASRGLAPLLPALAGVGQACLLRQHLQDELRDSCRYIVCTCTFRVLQTAIVQLQHLHRTVCRSVHVTQCGLFVFDVYGREHNAVAWGLLKLKGDMEQKK